MLVGLWGTAVLLLCCAALGAALARSRLAGRPGRLVLALGWLVGAVLVTRGVVVHLVLLTGAGGVAASVGAAQTRWSLVLWNPWFVVGGSTFLLAAAHRSHDR